MARKDVAEIRVFLRSGGPLVVQPSGQDAGFPFNFYAVVVPGSEGDLHSASVERVAAFDRAGREIDAYRPGPG